jgi:hypothetical protein
MRTIGIAVIVVALVAAFTGIVSATPGTTEGTAGGHVTMTSTTSSTTDAAIGGEIANLDLAGLQQTDKWQGYYGEVTGEITLDDDSGNTMYDWASVAATGGEVYATTNTTAPTWADFAATAATLSEVDTAFNLGSTSDNAANTFAATSNTEFAIGTITVTANFAPTVGTDGGIEGDAAWETVVLYDGVGTTTSDYLFVGLISGDTASFLAQDGGSETCDYQMIVPDDPAAGSQTTYYFYAEIT